MTYEEALKRLLEEIHSTDSSLDEAITSLTTLVREADEYERYEYGE